jgi:hypothetical protein
MTFISIAMLGWFGWAAGGALGSQFGTEKDSEETVFGWNLPGHDLIKPRPPM